MDINTVQDIAHATMVVLIGGSYYALVMAALYSLPAPKQRARKRRS